MNLDKTATRHLDEREAILSVGLYLMPIIKKYEIWEALADFLGIDPEDEVNTIFDDVSYIDLETDEIHQYLEANVRYVDDCGVIFRLNLYPRLNGDPHYLHNLTVISGFIYDEDMPLDQMAQFEVKSTPVMDGSVMDYMSVSILLDGLPIYDTCTHILPLDAGVPPIEVLTNNISDEEDLSNPNTWGGDLGGIPKCPLGKGNALVQNPFLKVSERNFPVALMYNVLKETVKILHLSSNCFIGITDFGVPYDTSLEKKVSYNKDTFELKYTVTGSIQDDSGEEALIQVAAAWRILAMTEDALGCPITFLPTDIHMEDKSSGRKVSCIVKVDEWKSLNCKATVNTLVHTGQKSIVESSFTEEISLPSYDKCVDLFGIYRNDPERLEKGTINIQEYLFIAREMISRNLSYHNAKAYLVGLFHNSGLEWLPDYSITDMAEFLDKIKLDPDKVEKVLDGLFKTTYDAPGVCREKILPLTPEMMAVLRS